jgi:AcrR family transcriptional regulator
MPRTAERGGPRTRARIAEVAAALFLERGFDAVTVADVARAAGVSSVTVFNHFPQKEDLFLDRVEDAERIIEEASQSAAGVDEIIDALEASALDLAERSHPLSGLNGDSLPFFDAVRNSRALTARARELVSALQHQLADGMVRQHLPVLHSETIAACALGGYAAAFRQVALARLAGGSVDEARAILLPALQLLFAALRDFARTQLTSEQPEA